MKRKKNINRELVHNNIQYIKFQTNLLTKKGNGEKIHFLDYSDNSIHFAINEIEKALDNLKKATRLEEESITLKSKSGMGKISHFGMEAI